MEKKTKKFSHLSKSERNEIAILLQKNYSLRNITKVVERAVSTISDEIKSNSVNGKYDSKKAHHKARARRKASKFQGKKIVADKELKEFVDKKLYENQTPKAIAGRLKKKK